MSVLNVVLLGLNWAWMMPGDMAHYLNRNLKYLSFVEAPSHSNLRSEDQTAN